MSDKYVLDSNGEPVPTSDLIAWGQWIATADRHVARDTVGDVVVSTVFLGLDHNFVQGRPVLWETMVFGGEFDQWQDRYSSRGEALEGHARAVAMVRGA